MNQTEIDSICNNTRQQLLLQQKLDNANIAKLNTTFNNAVVTARSNNSLTIQLDVLAYNDRVITTFISSIDKDYNVVRKYDAGESGMDYGDPGRAASYILHIARKF